MRSACMWTAIAMTLFAPAHARAADAPLKKLVMLDFHLLDETAGGASDASQIERLKKASDMLRREFRQRRFYDVVDNAPAQGLIDDLSSRYNLLDCTECAADISKALGTNRILTGWVQKISDQSLNISIQVTDVQSGRAVVNKSVFVRGNTDEAWLRGIRHMVRSMEEKRLANK